MTAAASQGGNSFYDAVIGAGLLAEAGLTIAQQLRGPRCAIITDTNVRTILGDRVRESLLAANLQAALIAIEPGESSKTMECVAWICDQLVTDGLDRSSFIVGLGGGVIGDVSGFVAAIYHRGIPHVQIPTTLLAMVDSSIGGKNGVNTAAGKNLVGAIHHPALVIDDVDVLSSLPPREFNQGFAEIIKHAIIADAALFGQLRSPEQLDLVALIRRNVEIKSRFVMADEMDRTGERALLNFGHTVGHAIEAAGEYRDFLHGEAISLGMVAACNVSKRKADLPAHQAEAVIELLQKFQLPTRLPADFPRDKILAALPLDKKFEGGLIRFVVADGIGSARLSTDVSMDDIREAVEQL